MPYKTIADLPDAVKNLPDDTARKAWMDAYNAAYKTYNGDEGKCAAVAWSTIEKMGYKKNKEGDWVKMARFIKDILYVGKFPHPQNEKETIDMTAAMLQNIADNSKRFMDAGGKIPMVISHPKKEQEKIENTEGFVTDVFIKPDDGRLYIEMDLSDKATQWIKDNKLTAVSPGIFRDVLTSVGKFPVLLDHVALTASPHLLVQGNFIPITASSYSGGAVYFENNAVSFELSLWERIRDWLEANILGGKKNDFIPEGGDDMDVKELEAKNTALEKESEKLREDAKRLQADLDAANKKVADYEATKKTEAEQAAANEKKEFEARLDKLVTGMKIKPANREALVAQYEQLKGLKTIEFENKKHTIPDYLLSRFETEDKKPASTTVIPVNAAQFQVDKTVYDLNTADGKDKLFELAFERTKKIAQEKKIDCPEESLIRLHPDIYAEAHQQVLAEFSVKPA